MLELDVRGRTRTTEVPVRYDERHAGRSEMDTREVMRFARHLAWLYRAWYPETARAITFGCEGLRVFVVDVAFYVALATAGADRRPARAATHRPAATWSWALNPTVTFGDRSRAGRIAQWARSVTASVASAAASAGAYNLIATASPWLDAQRTAALAHGAALCARVNFCLAQLWVNRSALRIDGVPPRGYTAWKEILQ